MVDRPGISKMTSPAPRKTVRREGGDSGARRSQVRVVEAPKVSLKPRRRLKRRALLDRMAAAYHEAGHAVIAYRCRWWIGREGVEIGRRQHTGLSGYERDRLMHEPHVSLAGRLAENKWRGLRNPFLARSALERCRRIVENAGGRAAPGGDVLDDDVSVVREIVRLDPTASAPEIARLFSLFEGETWDLINDPEVWRSIGEVAEALKAKSRLTASEVEKLLTFRHLGRNWRRKPRRRGMRRVVRSKTQASGT
jgi:hypothetical protein